MSLSERQSQFIDEAQKHFGASPNTQSNRLFGVSNSAKVVEGGILLGVANLDSIRASADAMILGCVMCFPPKDEVYFAVLVRKDIASLMNRLQDMKNVAAADKTSGSQSGPINYSERNNNVRIYLANDGQLWLRNAGFWDTLPADRTPFGPGLEPDEIVVALHPPTASASRSLLAREFVGWLGNLVHPDKVHELRVWTDTATLSPEMHRMPASIPIGDIEVAVESLGGYYPNGEVRRYHAALNFLSHKHFVILSGLSGTGKTQLALKYARAVHGLTSNSADDPLIFECPVRPEWTDPTGLTGYFDVLTNRYVVPTFLEAVLVATAHRESPVFVILDEMNLARVEYYLSDVLSCMETRGPLQLHSNSVPLEGTTGSSIRAELPLPANLFIIGTINVDETTNPVSDKVLDRASVIDMSTVDVPGFLATLQSRNPELKEACNASERTLNEIHGLMQQHGLGFGYRLIEEFVRYHAFDAEYLGSPQDDVTDQLLVQKVLVKLRGTERQRKLLTGLEKACDRLPRSLAFVRQQLADLDDFGSFQAMR